MRRIFSPYHESYTLSVSLFEGKGRAHQLTTTISNCCSEHFTVKSLNLLQYARNEWICLWLQMWLLRRHKHIEHTEISKELGYQVYGLFFFNARASLWRVSTFLYFSSCLHFDLIKIQKRRFCDYLVQNVDSSSVFELSVCPFCPF